jgi:hypothetical protein
MRICQSTEGIIRLRYDKILTCNYHFSIQISRLLGYILRSNRVDISVVLVCKVAASFDYKLSIPSDQFNLMLNACYFDLRCLAQ